MSSDGFFYIPMGRQATDPISRVRRDFPSDEESYGYYVGRRRRMANDRPPLADVSNGQGGGGGRDRGRHQEAMRGVRYSGLRRNYSWSSQSGFYGRGLIVPLGRGQNVADVSPGFVQEILEPRYGIIRCFGFQAEYRYN